MATTQIPPPGEGNGVDAFFARCGFSSETRNQCWLLIRKLFPDAKVEEVKTQGYCSYTLSVGHDKIIQFRPSAHKLHMAVAEAACDAYGRLAPRTQLLTVLKPTLFPLPKDYHHDFNISQPVDEGIAMEDDHDYFDVISLERIRGISLAEFRTSFVSSRTHRCSVVRQFARLIMTGWTRAHQAIDAQTPRIPGRVGGSLKWRLEKMRTDLPPRFAPFVHRAWTQLDKITSLPWVLTHGDIVPANIMVAPSQDRIGDLILTGMLDWAEAEYLPFGVALYGLEELLGETDSSGKFSYYPDQSELRALFWTQLEAEIAAGGPALSKSVREMMDDAHVLGVLLWHGIAFDNGKLNRVVQEGRDDEEILRLELFFAGRT